VENIMSDDEMKTFDIVFRGDIQFGQNLNDVKLKLQQLFKIDTVKVDALFSGKPVVLKRGLDKTSAEKYQDVLTKAGAIVELVSMTNMEQVKTVNTKPEPNKTQLNQTPLNQTQSASLANPAPPNLQTVSQGQWTLAPVGSLMMPTSARLAPVTRQFNLSVYSLRPVGGNLVDRTESRQAEPEPLIIPDYKVADVGTNLIDSSEKMELPILEIDVEDWGLSEPGAPLLADNEKAPEVSPIPSTNFSLANISLYSAIFTNNMQESEWFLSNAGSDCGIANVNIGTSGDRKSVV
jgi:hypothetical protein